MASPDGFRSRCPEYDPLGGWHGPDWDDPTREEVRARVEDVPPIRFLGGDEACTLAAIVERIVPQPDRAEADRVPIVPWIDAKLHDDTRDGYRYEGVPPQREAWRLGLRGTDESAQALCGRAFVALSAADQDAVLRQGGHILPLVEESGHRGRRAAEAPTRRARREV